MKYLDVWLHQPDSMIHPMQTFVREEDAVTYEELLAWNVHTGTGLESELFYVEADLERYRDALTYVESIREFAIAPLDEDSFHLYVCEETRPETIAWREAFTERDLVVVPPIRIDDTGAMGLTFVGDGEDIQGLLTDIPDEIDVTVVEIGTYGHRGGTLAGVLTDRQLEAASVAFDAGFYDVPRRASLAEVADTLEIAESSASVLLRRAERAVLSRVLHRGSHRSARNSTWD